MSSKPRPWGGVEAEAEACVEELHGPAAEPEEPTLRAYFQRAVAHGEALGLSRAIDVVWSYRLARGQRGMDAHRVWEKLRAEERLRAEEKLRAEKAEDA